MVTNPRFPAASPACVLTIAGSDSGGGAGIQADLKTFAAHSVHGLTAITAVTAQNTHAVVSVHQVPPREITRQIQAVFEDFDIVAVKLGMLGDAATVRAVARALSRARPRHVVLDPVMVASSGARLLADDAIHALRTRLLPLATVVTPNLPEAECLLGRPVAGLRDMRGAARDLVGLGCAAVLLKGGHLPRGPVVDLLLHAGVETRYSHPRLRLRAHGTGCTLASALAARLARGDSLPDAARAAVDYVHGALLHGYEAGAGRVKILNHCWQRLPRPAGA